MLAQAFEGYLENGRFFPYEQPLRKSGRLRAILTVLDESVQVNGITKESRNEWLNRLNESIALSMDEDLPDIPRSKEMRPPVIFND